MGRTTVAAAVATAAATRGRRVLLAEFEEPSHVHSSPLAGCFGRTVFPRDPTPVADRIWGLTLESERGTELFLTSVFKVQLLARMTLRMPALRRMLHAGPSFHEMGILYHLLHALQEQLPSGEPRFDLVVLDMPATGHTLALTGLPAILLRLVSRGPIAEALRAGLTIFTDPRQCAACVVTLPEPLPVSECVDLLAGLRESATPVGAVVANRVLPDPFTAAEHDVLDDLLVGGPVRGLTQVDRIRRAAWSLDRLARSVDVPVVPVLESDEPEPFRAVARQILAEAR